MTSRPRMPNLSELGPFFATVLFTLASQASVRIQPGTARPGDLVLVTVREADHPPRGRLGTAELDFYPLHDHRLTFAICQRPCKFALISPVVQRALSSAVRAVGS